MTFEVAKETIDRYVEMLLKHGKCVAEINFGGGEPLLAWRVIEQVLEYCRTRYGHEFEFRFSINTNASLITPEIAKVLKTYLVQIASSLDGMSEGNNRVRLTKTGKETFSAIMRGFEVLAAAGYPLDGFSLTLTDDNFREINESVIDWAVSRRMKDVRIDIDVIGTVEISLEDIVDKLMRLRHYARARDIEVHGFWSRPYENLGKPTHENHVSFCGAVGGNSMCVSPSGKIYGCGYSTTPLGKLAEVQTFHAPGSAYHCFVRDHFTGAIDMCKGCMIEGQCGGGCKISHEFAQATKNAKIGRMCDFYRRMTKEILLQQLRGETAQTP